MKIGDYEFTEDEFCGKKVIDGNLDLRSVIRLPDGFAPRVSGSIFLNSLAIDPERFAPTVGYGLYLNSLTSIHAGFNPTVGGLAKAA